MATKVILVTFTDGVQMFGTYSTVTDLANPEIQCVSDSDRPDFLSGKMLPGDIDVKVDCDTSNETVQCAVLHYGDLDVFTAWVSTARRVGQAGYLTGALGGEEYEAKIIGEALKINAALSDKTTNLCFSRLVNRCD